MKGVNYISLRRKIFNVQRVCEVRSRSKTISKKGAKCSIIRFRLRKKIVSRKELKNLVHHLKQQGKTIVTTNGSFDLLHIGHVTMLQEAKSLGDVLIIGLNSDSSIKRYKGKFRPICPEHHRVGMLAALACTDYITVFDELTPIELLGIIQPHIHVNSPEHGKECVEREVVEQHGGRIHLARLVEGMSTTRLLRRIQDSLVYTPVVAVFIRAETLVLACADTDTQKQREEVIYKLFTQFTQQGFQLVIFHTASDSQSEEAAKEFLEKNVLQERHESNITFCHSEQSAPELFEQLADERDLILAKSVVISHEIQDIQAGRAVNCKTILLSPPQATAEQVAESGSAAHIIAHTLQELPDLLQQF